MAMEYAVKKAKFHKAGVRLDDFEQRKFAGKVAIIMV
jgi:hypothetical protein